jgi:hypothetical protein
VESFVAAPGPAGWRYFGRVHEAGSEREVYVVDHVTDLDWRLIRLRLLGPEGEIVAERSPNGIHVVSAHAVEEVAGVDLTWSPSPWSVKVLREYLKGDQGPVDAARVRLGGPAERIRVELRHGDRGDSGVLIVDGSSSEAAFAADMPVRADGWFELIGGS